MPRPKRAKVASKVGRVVTTKPTQPAPRKQQPAKAQSSAPSEPPSFSDDSDGLVVKAARPQRRMPWQPAPQEGADFTMTGALPHGSEENVSAASKKAHTPIAQTPRTRTRKSSGKASTSRKSPMVSIPRSSRSARSNAIDTLEQDEDSSGFGDHLLSFTSLDSESPAHGTRPPSAIKVGATPAHETSLLALTNFKRRPRQPSLLRMVHQTTDVEDNDLDDLGDFDDFQPAAESTPLQVKKVAPAEGANDSGVNLSSSGSRGIKRKLSPVVQVPRSSPPYDSGPDIAESQPSSPSLPEVIQSTEEAEKEVVQDDPEVPSQTLAPPMSSSDYEANDAEHLPESPVRTRHGPRKVRSVGVDEDDEDNSEGEEPEPAKKRRGRPKTKKDRVISTAELQSLLPRRRTHAARDDEDGVAYDSDVDELALPARRQATLGRRPPPSKATMKSSRTGRKATAPEQLAQKNVRTYSRRTSSDKENEEAHEDDSGAEESSTIEVAAVKPSRSLEAIAKKFEDIDAFELDFESVSYVQTSSSPMR